MYIIIIIIIQAIYKPKLMPARFGKCEQINCYLLLMFQARVRVLFETCALRLTIHLFFRKVSAHP